MTPAGSLLLVRHGQSTWNVERRWQGRADPPLSPLGVEQARAAAAALPGGLRAVACSDLRRAVATAALLAAAVGLAVDATEAALRERDVGPWEGLTRAQIEARDPGFLDRGERPAGFEDDAAILARVAPALGRLAAALPAPLLVVAHEAVIRTLERAGGGGDAPMANLGARWFAPAHGGGWTVVGPRVALLPS